MLVTAIHPDEGRLTRSKCRWETKNILFYSSLVVLYIYICIQLFRQRLSQKRCTRQSRKVMWDMINTLVLDTVVVEPTFVLSFSPRKHTSMASRAILWNFFEKQWTKNHPQYLSGLSCALFPTTFLETAVYIIWKQYKGMILVLCYSIHQWNTRWAFARKNDFFTREKINVAMGTYMCA